MTKPSYEELEQSEKYLTACITGKGGFRELLDAANDELARVRGLLQRQWIKREELEKALVALKRGTCWCEVAIDNPNYQGIHTDGCKLASAAMEPDSAISGEDFNATAHRALSTLADVLGIDWLSGRTIRGVPWDFHRNEPALAESPEESNGGEGGGHE